MRKFACIYSGRTPKMDVAEADVSQVICDDIVVPGDSSTYCRKERHEGMKFEYELFKEERQRLVLSWLNKTWSCSESVGSQGEVVVQRRCEANAW